VPLASIPDPGQAAWHLGPLSLRAYTLCVIVGILVAIAVAARRYRDPGVILDVAAWAVPFGLLGAAAHAALDKLKHDFTAHPHLWHAATTAVAAIGVPGAIVLGAVGAWIACRRAKIPFAPVAGAAAPAVAFGLAVGGMAHWWAQDFYGRPATWWLAERVTPEHRVSGFENYATFQPAFLYQSIWDVIVGVVTIWAARRFALTGERTFLFAAAIYAAGSLWVESIRVGPMPRIFGMPYGAWGDLTVLAVAAAALYLSRGSRGPRGSQPHPRFNPPRHEPRVPLAGDSPGDVISL